MSRRQALKSRGGVAQPEAPSPAVSEPSRHLLRALEEERKRISRELHDEAGQGLMVLRLYLSVLAGEHTEFQVKMQQATDLLDRTIGDLRRIIARLSPRVLDELGLMAAIRKEARDLSKNTGMKSTLQLSLEADHFDPDTKVAIYRCVQEGLHNIAKHSKARKFRVLLKQENWTIALSVEDDGVGFVRKGNTPRRSFGLIGMRERIAALGGTVRIQSNAGRGTRLRVVLPLSSAQIASQQKARGEIVAFSANAAGRAS